jgi:hypothetical protein
LGYRLSLRCEIGSLPSICTAPFPNRHRLRETVALVAIRFHSVTPPQRPHHSVPLRISSDGETEEPGRSVPLSYFPVARDCELLIPPFETSPQNVADSRSPVKPLPWNFREASLRCALLLPLENPKRARHQSRLSRFMPSPQPHESRQPRRIRDPVRQ